jgi:hypothetical protein
VPLARPITAGGKIISNFSEPEGSVFRRAAQLRAGGGFPKDESLFMTPDPQTQLISQLLGVFLAALAGAWVMHDALKRGKNTGEAFLWAAGTWLLLIVFLPLWLWVRPRLGNQPNVSGFVPPLLCRYCGQPSGDDPYFCAACGRQLKGVGNLPR